jgi:CrcB protein
MPAYGVADEPFDPDYEPRQRRHRPDVLTAVAIGGAIGAFGRYESNVHWPISPGTFPTTTFVVNTSGSLLIGVLMVLIVERWRSPRLARPFLCVGILGGWTTMSTFATEAVLLLRDGKVLIALAYVVATVAAGLPATWLGIFATRRLQQ